MVNLLTGDDAKLRDEMLNRIRAELVRAAEHAVDHSWIHGHGHSLYVIQKQSHGNTSLEST